MAGMGCSDQFLRTFLVFVVDQSVVNEGIVERPICAHKTQKRVRRFYEHWGLNLVAKQNEFHRFAGVVPKSVLLYLRQLIEVGYRRAVEADDYIAGLQSEIGCRRAWPHLSDARAG